MKSFTAKIVQIFKAFYVRLNTFKHEEHLKRFIHKKYFIESRQLHSFRALILKTRLLDMPQDLKDKLNNQFGDSAQYLPITYLIHRLDRYEADRRAMTEALSKSTSVTPSKKETLRHSTRSVPVKIERPVIDRVSHRQDFSHKRINDAVDDLFESFENPTKVETSKSSHCNDSHDRGYSCGGTTHHSSHTSHDSSSSSSSDSSSGSGGSCD